MQLFSKKQADNVDAAGEQAKKKPKTDIKQQLQSVIKLAAHYETTLVALAVAGLLAVTSLRMLKYMDPQVDDTKVQESISKSTKARIDPKIVDKIKQLKGSGTPTPTKVESGRSNPFTEN
jgi:hypothetical protein